MFLMEYFFIQATLHVGDEIREINGISVANQSIESLQKLLREARGSVTFKVKHQQSWDQTETESVYLQIVPSYRSAPPPCDIFVRAQFEYDPLDDDLIPCAQAGIPFNTGDILQVRTWKGKEKKRSQETIKRGYCELEKLERPRKS